MKMLKQLFCFSLVVMLLVGCGNTNSAPSATTQKEDAKTTEAVPATKAPKAEKLPLEIQEVNYEISHGYLYYSLKIHNPNDDFVYEYPAFRVVARDSSGALLGTCDQTLTLIYPNQDFYYASQGFAVEETPDSLDVSFINVDEKNYVKPSSLNHKSYIPMEVSGTSLKNDIIMGEISNENEYDISMAIVTIVFKDADGNIISGTNGFVDDVKAGEKTPFSVALYQEFATEDFDVFANIWMF